MWLGSHVAVSVLQAGKCSSDYTASLETSIRHRCGDKKPKKKKNQKNKLMIFSPKNYRYERDESSVNNENDVHLKTTKMSDSLSWVSLFIGM